MDLIAHRGFAAENPENTLLAVRRAVEAGADAVEVDVRRCGSGELVVIHDDAVDRVTDGSGAVADHSLADLRALDILDTGEGVPTLSAVVDALPPAVGLNAELKTAVADDALDVLAAHDGQVLVSSFDPDHLRAVADLDSSVPTALLVAGRDEDPVERAREADCDGLHPSVEAVDAGLVERAHAAGLFVNAWTVADRSTVLDLGPAGVDGVIADSPDVRADGDAAE